MIVITTTEALAAFCQRAHQEEFVTVDTEFLREHTYFAKLCLVQLAIQGDEEENAVVVDVMAEGIDLAPLMTLFKDESVLKIFHAARQDLEIFYHEFGVLPSPFYDTQIAAMVAGFGEQVGYETLVKVLCKGKVDKTSRFTDWSRRPLSDAQLIYARSDVTYLRDVYLKLVDKLEASGRTKWVAEETSKMVDPALYEIDPYAQWKRVRARSTNPKFLGLIRELAAFREFTALQRNCPRNRVLKDDAILELAAQKPRSVNDLLKLRLWPKDQKKGALVDGVLEAIAKGVALKPADLPVVVQNDDKDRVDTSVTDLLKVYLKAQSDRHDVASKLICTSAELDAFAADPDGDHPLSIGWRFEMFGRAARDLIAGKVALKANGKFVEPVEVPDDEL